MPARFKSFSVTSTGPVSISARIGTDIGKMLDAGARLKAHGVTPGLGADQNCGRAINDTGRIAGMVHVVDALDFRMCLDADGIKAAHLAGHLEGGVEGSEILHRRCRTHMLVLGKDGDAVLVLHRDHRLVEIAAVPGMAGALLALDRIGIDVVARETILGGDEIGGNALRHEIAGEVDRRVHVPGTAGHAHADARHRFHATGNNDVIGTGRNLAGREIHGIEARRAKTRDLHAGRLVGIAGLKGGRLRDHGAGLEHRIDAAHDDVIDGGCIQPIAVAQRLQHLGGQTRRRHFVQAPHPSCPGRAACARGRK